MTKTLYALAVAAALLSMSAPARALDVTLPPPAGYDIVADTAPILNVAIATHQFTSITGLSGGWYVVAQSTDAVGFCCSFEAGAATTTVAGTSGCINAKKEPGGGFYELTLKRWARDLVLRCQSLKTEAQGSAVLRVLQGR